MTNQGNHELILQKLDQQSEQITALCRKVDKFAVQEERVATLREHVQLLLNRYDSDFGPNGTIYRIKEFQAACPGGTIENIIKTHRETTNRALKTQWGVIAVLASLVSGALFKAFGGN